MVDLVVRSDRLGTFRKKSVDKWKAEASFCDIAIPLIPYQAHAPPPPHRGYYKCVGFIISHFLYRRTIEVVNSS